MLEAVDATLKHLLAHPESGVSYPTRNPGLKEARMLPVIGFQNYLIFYRADRETVRVLYVVHGARHLPRLFQRERRN